MRLHLLLLSFFKHVSSTKTKKCWQMHSFRFYIFHPTFFSIFSIFFLSLFTSHQLPFNAGLAMHTSHHFHSAQLPFFQLCVQFVALMHKICIDKKKLNKDCIQDAFFLIPFLSPKGNFTIMIIPLGKLQVKKSV